MSRKKRNMFEVCIYVYNAYITSELKKNNKVKYCSDEKERKIRGEGPP